MAARKAKSALRSAAVAADRTAATPQWLREQYPEVDITTPDGRLVTLAVLQANLDRLGMTDLRYDTPEAHATISGAAFTRSTEVQVLLWWINLYAAMYRTGLVDRATANFTWEAKQQYIRRLHRMTVRERLMEDARNNRFNPQYASPALDVDRSILAPDDWRLNAEFWMAAMTEDNERFLTRRPTGLERAWAKAAAGTLPCSNGRTGRHSSFCFFPGRPVYGYLTSHRTLTLCQHHAGATVRPLDAPDEEWRRDALATVRRLTGVDEYYRTPERAGLALVCCPNCSRRFEVGGGDEDAVPPCYACGYVVVGGRIQNYSAAPAARLLTSKREGKVTAFFGVELEMEFGNCTYAQDVLDSVARPKLFIFKTDTSIRHGVEMVTSPMSYERWRDDRTAWADRLRVFRTAGFRSYDTTTCGMHIHVSRAAFTPTAGYLLQSFVYDNALFMQALAQRPSNNYTKYADVDAIDRRYRIKKARVCRPGDQDAIHGERHQAINFPSNRPTVEVRIFRGTLNDASFFKNLEVVASLTHFLTTAGLTRGQQPMAYIDYVFAHESLYPNLATFMRRKQAIIEAALAGKVPDKDAYSKRLAPPLPMKAKHPLAPAPLEFAEANC